MTGILQLLAEAESCGIQKLVVGAVVHHGGQILILRRSAGDDFLPGIEELPSGGVEEGESLLAALHRELAEEIGWTGPVTLDPGFVSKFDYLSGSGRRARQFTFGVPYNGGPIVLSEEHTSARWIEPKGAASADLSEETLQVVRDWAASQLFWPPGLRPS